MSVVEKSQCDVDYREVVTMHDAKIVAERALRAEAEVLDYSIQAYVDEKIGFLSSHQRLEIKIRKNLNLDDSPIVLSFFVKAIPYDVPSQATYVQEKGVFLQEAAFFEAIVPELTEEYCGEAWGPRCYLVKHDALVFEDLGHQGFRMREKLFDEKLIKSGLRALANFHAASIIAEERLGRSLNKLCPQAFKERAFLTWGNQYKWYLAGVDVAVRIAEEMGLDASLIPSACRRVFKAVQPSATKCNVVSHGDLWSNNLMFDDQTSPNCRLVDFQLLRYSPLAHDVAQFLYLCASRRLRDTQVGRLLRYYYEALLKCLKMNPRIQVAQPAWQDLVQGWEEQRLGAAVTAIMYFPTVLLDGTLGAKIMNDSESYAKFVFNDRRDVVMENMKRDEDYNSRLREIVRELVEMSFKLDSLPVPC